MKQKVTLTPEELWGLAGQGYSRKALAQHMGVSHQRITQLIDRADFMVDIDRWECGHDPACLPDKRDEDGLRGDIYVLRLRGLRLSEIARELGISKQRVWQVESGGPASRGVPLGADRGQGPRGVLDMGGTPSLSNTEGGRAA